MFTGCFDCTDNQLKRLQRGPPPGVMQVLIAGGNRPACRARSPLSHTAGKLMTPCGTERSKRKKPCLDEPDRQAATLILVSKIRGISLAQPAEDQRLAPRRDTMAADYCNLVTLSPSLCGQRTLSNHRVLGFHFGLRVFNSLVTIFKVTLKLSL